MGDTILVIHNSNDLRESVRKFLEPSGYYVSGAEDFAASVCRVSVVAPSLLLLQWSDAADTEAAIGDLKAYEGMRASRIIVIAPEAEISDAIVSLEFGADDCLAIPFTTEELVGRVNACFRRPPSVSRHDRVRAGPLLLDRVAHRLCVSDESVSLAPTEFRLMEFFMEHHGRAFSRQELLQNAWPRHVKAGRRTVDVNVRRLRQALEPFGCDHFIQTVRGYGYRFSLDDRAVTNRPPVSSAEYTSP